METLQRLSGRMRADTLRFGPDIKNWNQFVRDHKSYLRSIATKQTFTPEVMCGYRYRPEEFYVDHAGIVQATWIWMYINDIRDITEFNESRTQFFMLPWEEIRELFQLYRRSENADDE